ncbi:MAG: diaminopimelate epimerase [Ignavibacteriales bacterium]|nr:diaminopimelate epimerase [Ignavibacteriales bacterium]HOJ18036.1 diaminopimelate epimerase [Ignavibacteriaceae bacterium]
MEKVTFTKINGAGNDFIFIDKDSYPSLQISPVLVRKLCHRRFGIGGDGLITIAKTDGVDFEMTYYNADGSLGSLCGNGARSSILFASLFGKAGADEMKFRVNNEIFSGKIISKDMIKFYLNQPRDLKKNLIVASSLGNINCQFLNTGSPHVIINIKDIPGFNKPISELDVIAFGKELRYSPLFAPGGANINFIELADGKVFIRTYERGVEDETLACGTGSTAAGIIAKIVYNLNPPVALITAGGDSLIVDFNLNGDVFEKLSLTGPANVSFKGEIYI